MKHEYNDGSTKIIVEVHDNAPNNIKLEHLKIFNRLVSMVVQSLRKTAKEVG